MKDSNVTTSRRSMLKRSALTATGMTLGLGAVQPSHVIGANEKIRMGFIGVGNRGSQLLNSFMKNDDVEVVALCDVYDPYLTRDGSEVDKELLEALGGRIPRLGEEIPGDVGRYKDFRRVLDRKDVDAVCIATPDHWHAVQTIMSLEAGKDVYVEKPLSITIHEGREMVKAAAKTDRVVQVGLHRRSSRMYAKLAEIVQNDAIGIVSTARAFRVSNMYPHGIGEYKPRKPIKGLDWDMWLGPRAERDYKQNITPYKFRWWGSYSSQVANWGVHYCDAIRWVLNEQAPVSISAHGTKVGYEDDRTVPTTMQVIFEMPSGALVIFGQYEASGGPAILEGEIEFRGTLGNLYSQTSGRGYKILPTGGGQFQERDKLIEPVEEGRIDGDLTDQHVRNFLDCVHSRDTCNCDLETGHRSTTFALLANIALETRSRLEWDAKEERIVNNKEANELLHYEYRKPWNLG